MEDDDYMDRLYVRHPDRDRVYTEEELAELRLAATLLQLPLGLGAEFDVTQGAHRPGPIGRVHGVLGHHKHGLYPPLETLDWLAEGFQAWLDSDGQQSLEKCLGLRSRGQAGNAIKEEHRRRVGNSAIVLMHRLRILFGLKVRDAAAMVAALLEEQPELDEPPRHNLPPLSADTLEDRYRHAAWIRNESVDARIVNHSTEESRRAFLATFPRWSWEHIPELLPYQ
jgi:hypothetical protein